MNVNFDDPTTKITFLMMSVTLVLWIYASFFKQNNKKNQNDYDASSHKQSRRDNLSAASSVQNEVHKASVKTEKEPEQQKSNLNNSRKDNEEIHTDNALEKLEKYFKTIIFDKSARERLLRAEEKKYPNRTRYENIENIIESYNRDRRI
jgi:hypothetical protein